MHVLDLPDAPATAVEEGGDEFVCVEHLRLPEAGEVADDHVGIVSVGVHILMALLRDEQLAVGAPRDAIHVRVDVERIFEAIAVEVVDGEPGPAEASARSALRLAPAHLAGAAVDQVALPGDAADLDDEVHARPVAEVAALPVHQPRHVPGRRRARKVLEIARPGRRAILE